MKHLKEIIWFWGFFFWPGKMYYGYFLRSVLSAWHQRPHLLSAMGTVLLWLQRCLRHVWGGKLLILHPQSKATDFTECLWGLQALLAPLNSAVSGLRAGLSPRAAFGALWLLLKPRGAFASAPKIISKVSWGKLERESSWEPTAGAAAQSSRSLTEPETTLNLALWPSLCWESSCIPWALQSVPSFPGEVPRTQVGCVGCLCSPRPFSALLWPHWICFNQLPTLYKSIDPLHLPAFTFSCTKTSSWLDFLSLRAEKSRCEEIFTHMYLSLKTEIIQKAHL